ncbi:hypothetical protein SAMN05216326_13319 [Nitrosomonas marina]|uniref:Uncharacterized protein n=1 Tax=Nitrosomonas marina TaxID=917 RepID=A0A1I0F6E2_9PROT|nr:hypothetical protein [Nitrosomonas marina]SET52651.1 hypothetical protein SAMN05216326_13319 [Nitrosomonas marina]
MRFAILVLLAVLLWAPFCIYSNGNSVYVSLQTQSCRTPGDLISRYYTSRNLEVSECPTKVSVQSAPLRLFVVSSNERSWIDLALGKTIWSSEDEIVYEKENQFGYFPNVSNAPAEIRMRHMEATGLIFRITAQAPEDRSSTLGASNVSRLFVLAFRDSAVCFLGLVRNNTTARNLLDSDAACQRVLKSEQLR